MLPLLPGITLATTHVGKVDQDPKIGKLVSGDVLSFDQLLNSKISDDILRQPSINETISLDDFAGEAEPTESEVLDVSNVNPEESELSGRDGVPQIPRDEREPRKISRGELAPPLAEYADKISLPHTVEPKNTASKPEPEPSVISHAVGSKVSKQDGSFETASLSVFSTAFAREQTQHLEKVVFIQPKRESLTDGKLAKNISPLEEAIAKTHIQTLPPKAADSLISKAPLPESAKLIATEVAKTHERTTDIGQGTKSSVVPVEQIMQTSVLKRPTPQPEYTEFGKNTVKKVVGQQHEQPEAKVTQAVTKLDKAELQVRPISTPSQSVYHTTPSLAAAPKTIQLPQHDFRKSDIAETNFRIEMSGLHGDRTGAPLQISQPSSTQPHPVPTMSEQARQIAQQLAHATPTQAPGTTEITLNPEELGRVRMSLTLLDGAMTLTIQAERPDTADLMRRHIDQLAQTYRQLGFTNMAFNFEGAAQQQSHTPPPYSSNDDTLSDDPIFAQMDASPPKLTTSGRLDLRF